MARKPNNVSKTSVQRLQQSVREKSGLSLDNFSDIQQLQFQIKKDTGEYLSIQTLNRFFHLIRNSYKPSSTTVGILCRYAGFDSFQDFERMSPDLPVERNGGHISSQMVISLFAGIENPHDNDQTLTKMMKNLCLLIDKCSVMAGDVYPFLANSEFGRRYFYEQFVNIDALNSHYGEGLNYYMIHIRNREEKFFAYALLCQRYLLTCEYEQFHHYYEKVMEYGLEEVKTFHPFLIGRYYAVQVYNSVINETSINIINEALETFSGLNRNCNWFKCFPCAEYVLGEALILASRHFLAWQVLESQAHSLKKMPVGFEQGYITQYELLRYYSGFFSGQVTKKKASDGLIAINEKQFYFLSRNYFSFFFYNLAKTVMPKTHSKSADLQLLHMIEKTGFVYFRKKMEGRNPSGLYLMDIKGKKIV